MMRSENIPATSPVQNQVEQLNQAATIVDERKDPANYFAAERTLLSWLRTGIGIMAFGFVVSRFSLFVKLIRSQGAEIHGSNASPYIGAFLVFSGAISIYAGCWRYKQYCSTLEPGEIPRVMSTLFPILLSSFIASLGIFLFYILLPS